MFPVFVIEELLAWHMEVGNEIRRVGLAVQMNAPVEGRVPVRQTSVQASLRGVGNSFLRGAIGKPDCQTPPSLRN